VLPTLGSASTAAAQCNDVGWAIPPRPAHAADFALGTLRRVRLSSAVLQRTRRGPTQVSLTRESADHGSRAHLTAFQGSKHPHGRDWFPSREALGFTEPWVAALARHSRSELAWAPKSSVAGKSRPNPAPAPQNSPMAGKSRPRPAPALTRGRKPGPLALRQVTGYPGLDAVLDKLVMAAATVLGSNFYSTYLASRIFRPR
jgi:hypothetical protein